MQVKAVIIDDEPDHIETLALLLRENCPEVGIVATAYGADEGRKIILEHDPGIVFLDIEMPDKTGFQLLKSLNNYSFEVIFVTGHDKYWTKGFEFAAIYYLLKPVSINLLQQAVGRAAERYSEKKQNHLLENLFRIMQSDEMKKHCLPLPGFGETRYIPVGDIIRCQSDNRYTRFFITGEKSIIAAKSILEYEKILEPYGFIRCHQSHLVNKSYIKSWKRENSRYLLLKDGTMIPANWTKKEMIRILGVIG